MSTFRSIQPAEATGLTKTLFDGLQQKLGMVPKLAQQLANSPAALKAYLNWGANLSEGALNAKLREQIAVAVATENGCDYCLSAHTVLGSLTGLTNEALQSAQNAEASDPKSAAALRFAVKVVRDRGHLDVSEVHQLRSAGLSDAEIVEIIAVVAVNIFTNYFNHIAGTEIDFPVAAHAPRAAHSR
jgi:uncharacterized peroxidase-related enzyme